MPKLLMITGLGSARDLASGKKGAFYSTLEEFHKYWERIDIVVPKVKNLVPGDKVLFGNVHLHISSRPLILHPFYFVRKCLKIYEEQKFDFMIVHEFPPFYNGIGARLLWNKIKVPYILEIMHIPGHPRAANSKEKIYKLLFRLFIKIDSQKAKAIRVINKKEVPQFLKESGIAEGKLVYIPAFYIDLRIFRPMEVQKKYDLVFAARLEKNKGIQELIEAVAIAKKKKTDTSLLIIGSGSLKNKLTGFVKKNGLDKNIQFSGWLRDADDVAAAYNSAKIFVNPSFNEGGPRVVLEAMACGLPVLTTKVGMTLDIIKDKENGIFIDWDPNDMAEKILNLLRNERLMAQLSAKGKEAVGQFKRKEVIKNYADKIKELI